jgi:hypothetical protein
MVIYLVRTVCELILLKRDTGPPARIHEEMLRVFAVFFEGLDIMVTGAESKVAQTRPGVPSALLSPDKAEGGGSIMSRDNWKLFAFAVPVTCKNLKLPVMLLSKLVFWSNDRSPCSETTDMASCWERICHTGP